MTLPIGFALLFFMAVAPALPWRKAAHGSAPPPARGPGMGRVPGSSWSASLAGVRGFTPLLAFGLGGFAGGERVAPAWCWPALASHRAGGRRLAGAFRSGQRRDDRSSRRRRRGRGARGRELVRAADAARAEAGPVGSLRRSRLHLRGLENGSASRTRAARSRRFSWTGHRSIRPSACSPEARGSAPRRWTPRSARTPTSRVADIDLSAHGPATIDVVIQPMVLWLWVGGAITAFGAVLAAAPSRRRRGAERQVRSAGYR